MEVFELEAMTLDELRVHAAARGVAGAAALAREALMEALVGPPPKAAPSLSSTTRPRTPGGSPWGEVPSSVVPARPVEHDTETMARLYFEQGHEDRAAEIYRRLLAADPSNPRLEKRLADAEAAVARRAGKVAPTAPKEPEKPAEEKAPPAGGEPFGVLDWEELPDAYGVDECELIARDPGTLFTYWEVTDAGLADARGHLGADAEGAHLVLRIFTVSGDGRDTRDVALDGTRGRRYLSAQRSGVLVRAAVGLVSPAGLFAPVAHSSTVRVPPAEPAPPSHVEWMEVEPARSRGLKPEPIQIVRAAGTAPPERGLPTEPPTGEGPTSPGRRTR
jgi:hypothetical protein